jgi:drug/metabolite transporter (DMT)-like permease
MHDGVAKPVLLLIGAGSLGGVSILLSKLAALAGIPPLSYLFWQSLGAGLVLAVVAGMRGQWPSLSGRYLRYYVVAGLVSLAFPMGLGYFMVPFLGASMAGIFMALPPLITYLISLGVGLERMQTKRMLGLMIGFAGVVILYVPEIRSPQTTVLVYLLFALLIPLSLALGNVYRTLDWPGGASPIALASGMMLASAVMCAGFEETRDHLLIPMLSDHRAWTIIGVQMIVASLMYMCHFELQRVAGPVFLSQIGYVMALTSLLGGTLLMGEEFRPVLLVTLACVVAGTFLVRPARPAKTADQIKISP